MSTAEIRHFHLFAGLGGGAKGFNQGHARVGTMEAQFRCIGGVDNDAAAMKDFEKLAGAPGTVLDMFDRQQYEAFHGRPAPDDWIESTPQDIQRAAGGERPNIVFLSAPCKGFSGLLSQKRSGSEKYQALNGLTLRGIWLMLEAFQDDPPELVVFENVPRIANRGRHLLDQIVALLRQYGYAVAETTHDCGNIGGLAQSRRRFLLVGRHEEKVPPFLYEPPHRPLRGVGQVLENLPLPGDQVAGPMHRIPKLQWRTWVRLALVEAGKDWRSLERLAVEDGVLRDYGIIPEKAPYSGALGVLNWHEPAGTITSRACNPNCGRFSVADPRFEASENWNHGQQFGVHRWGDPTGVITGQRSPGQGRFAVADPRAGGSFQGAGKYRITPWKESAFSVISGSTTGQGAFAVADPRLGRVAHNNVYRVVPWDEARPAVTAGGGPTAGGLAIADPRAGWGGTRPNYQTGGHYGVIPWQSPSYVVSGTAKHDRGPFSVADPRIPEPTDRGAYIIRALDGTWHRPFTTLELAALQGLTDGSEFLELEGRSDSDWRERIGNAVPPPAAQAIASVMGETLLLAWAGETFTLGQTPIWVRDVAMALAVQQPQNNKGVS